MKDRFAATALAGLLAAAACLATPLPAKDTTSEQTLIRDNTAFAVDLYHALGENDGNRFFSPHSISTALAMTAAGARGNTAAEMTAALRFTLESEALHPAFAALRSRFERLQAAGDIELRLANSLWPQKDYAFLATYLALLKTHYGVSISPVDFKRAAEAARGTINDWVEDRTQGKISDLIPPGVLNALTRLVLVNAIYFKGDWQYPFAAEATTEAPFYSAPGTTVTAPLMTQQRAFRYARRDGVQALELPYAGGELSMLVLLPESIGGLAALENTLTAGALAQWDRDLREQKVRVWLPKFKMTDSFRLDRALVELGMMDAFNPDRANFAGMDGRTDWLYIGAALHKAFVEVNEAGTEAAASTAVVMMARAALPEPVPTFRADHPFFFLIRDNGTGAVLFLGRVTDPTEAGH